MLFVAFELSEKTWKLGFTTGHGQKPRERTVTARHHEQVLTEIAQAKRRFGLPEAASVVSCYEAGREGFWLHRFLQAHGITNHIVDSSSMEVNRRQRRSKSDGLDVRKLLSMLLRYAQGERQVWQVVKVPSVEAEDQRHLHRDLETLKQERASTITRIEGLLSSQGLRVPSLAKLPEQLEALRLWDGSPLPPGLRRRVLRVYAQYTFLSEQIAEVEAERRAQLQTSSDASIDKVRQLMQLKGIGSNGAWLLVMEFGSSWIPGTWISPERPTRFLHPTASLKSLYFKGLMNDLRVSDAPLSIRLWHPTRARHALLPLRQQPRRPPAVAWR
jgi:transposase